MALVINHFADVLDFNNFNLCHGPDEEAKMEAFVALCEGMKEFLLIQGVSYYYTPHFCYILIELGCNIKDHAVILSLFLGCSVLLLAQPHHPVIFFGFFLL